jgi:hypothetical protein
VFTTTSFVAATFRTSSMSISFLLRLSFRIVSSLPVRARLPVIVTVMLLRTSLQVTTFTFTTPLVQLVNVGRMGFAWAIEVLASIIAVNSPNSRASGANLFLTVFPFRGADPGVVASREGSGALAHSCQRLEMSGLVWFSVSFESPYLGLPPRRWFDHKRAGERRGAVMLVAR